MRWNRSRDRSRLNTKQQAGPFFSRNLQFSKFVPLWKSYFTTNQHLNPAVRKPNYQKVSANCENLQRHKFASWVKVSLLQKKYGSKTTNHSQLAWPFDLHVKQTQRNIACDWLIFSRSHTCCLAVSSLLDLTSLFRKMSFVSILPKLK